MRNAAVQIVENRGRMKPVRAPAGRGGWPVFLLGMVAGGIVVGTGTVAAVRQPAVQARLGLIEPSPPTLVVARKPENCPAPSGPAAEKWPGRADLLFDKNRFWSVRP